MLECALRVCAHPVRVAEPGEAGVHRDGLVHDGAEQDRDRYTLALRDEVPQRDIDAADSGGHDALVAVLEGGPCHALPERFDVGDGVAQLADAQRREERFDEHGDGQHGHSRGCTGLVGAPPGLAGAGEAVLGGDAHEQLRVVRVRENLDTDVRDPRHVQQPQCD
ncbi:unannotated protein [freshwater metagenome]|uniref:Unannotated protein n=1 Tax=freshwater metagenome TaxID=449393 RepID=A0A6J7EY36_9ZZZZ